MRVLPCLTCKNTGMIDSPPKEIICIREIYVNGDWIIDDLSYWRGGVDACPTCAARAEAEYAGLPIFREVA